MNRMIICLILGLCLFSSAEAQKGGKVKYAVEVSVTGAGTVTSSTGGISCQPTCSTSVNSGTAITFTAMPDSGATFSAWGGACTGTIATCSLTIGSDTSLSATFEGGGGGGGGGGGVTLEQLQTELDALRSEVSTLQALLSGVERVVDGYTQQDTIRISGVNLQLVNGIGQTSSVNGVGNLIVGYNEGTSGDPLRSGSHNIVMGDHSGYSSYAGFVTGRHNKIYGPFNSVIGGDNNSATGEQSVIVAGNANTASGISSLVAGGSDNVAAGPSTTVVGNSNNLAQGDGSVVLGGYFNRATGYGSAIISGRGNQAANFNSIIALYSDNTTTRDGEVIAPGAGVEELQALLAGVERVTNEYTQQDTIRIVGADLQIVNGAGNTGTQNGVGNLIIGYNEGGADCKTGSHNLVGGFNPCYQSYGGIVAGAGNRISGPYSSVIGGEANEATAYAATVTGGNGNNATGNFSAVGGGYDNTASGVSAVVVGGGFNNEASGMYATVIGGRANVASGDSASVFGHERNVASGFASTIVATNDSVASGTWSALLGAGNALADSDGQVVVPFNSSLQDQVNGLENSVSGLEDVLAGVSRTTGEWGYDTILISGANLQIVNGTGTTSTANGTGNLIVGYNGGTDPVPEKTGSHNVVVGEAHGYSSYGGIVSGTANRIYGSWSSIIGGAYNLASPVSPDQQGNAVVIGGYDNTASGLYSTVLGGWENQADGWRSTVAGGLANYASGENAAAFGGSLNIATGPNSATLGGRQNLAEGYQSVAVGGGESSVLGSAGSVFGGRGNQVGTSSDHTTVVGGDLRECNDPSGTSANTCSEGTLSPVD